MQQYQQQIQHGMQAEAGTSLNPYQTAILTLVLFVAAGFCLGLVAGLAFDRQAGYIVFGIVVLAGLFWSTVTMASIINLKAHILRSAADAHAQAIVNDSEARRLQAEAGLTQIQAQAQAPAQIAAPAGEYEAAGAKRIRVFVTPKKGPAAIYECKASLVRQALTECWPTAAREYTQTNGQIVRIWQHRDGDFTTVALFLVNLGVWLINGGSYAWAPGFDQQGMMQWYGEAMKGGGDVAPPEPKPPPADITGAYRTVVQAQTRA